MSLKAGLYTYLKADVTLSALVVERIFPDYADQNTTRPYITYQDITQRGTHHLGGVSPRGLTLKTIQFSVWADTPKSRSDVEAALRQALDGQQRTTFGSTYIGNVTYTSGNDTHTTPDDGGQDSVAFGKFMDFDIWHDRTP